MPMLICDERRRITLPKELAEEGDKFIAIKIRGEIILKPLSKDPVKKLQEQGKKLQKLSIRELRKLALKEAENEVLEEFEKRIKK